jgi:hypothetical protein
MAEPTNFSEPFLRTILRAIFRAILRAILRKKCPDFLLDSRSVRAADMLLMSEGWSVFSSFQASNSDREMLSVAHGRRSRKGHRRRCFLLFMIHTGASTCGDTQ